MYETDRISDMLTAEAKGEARSDAKWQNIVAGKNAEISRIVSEKDAEIADKDAEIARLCEQLG
jgi:hypothetical protein